MTASSPASIRGSGPGKGPTLLGRVVRVVLAVGALILLAGCAEMFGPRPPPVTVPEVVAMAKAGVPAEQIVEKMRHSGTVYRLKASQLADLRHEGVPDAVINYMQETYLEAVRRDQEFRDWSYWTFRGGYWYGGYPFGWPPYWY